MRNIFGLKNIGVLLLLSLLLLRCEQVDTTTEERSTLASTTEKYTKKDDGRFLEHNTLKLAFENPTDTTIVDQHVRQLIQWRTTWRDSVSSLSSVIIVLNGTINTASTFQVANARMKQIKAILDGTIGIDTEDIPVVPVAFTYTYEGVNENYVSVEPNLLRYPRTE